MKEMLSEIYCLDANVLIVPWLNHYSPDICPDYWRVLSELGRTKKIFIPEEVYDEIMKQEDGLAEWLRRDSQITVRPKDTEVCSTLSRIFATPVHARLVDSVRGRSLADPWVIAHAICASATVVTREQRSPDNTPKIRIPNVCENMNVRCIDDLKFAQELNLRFSCAILPRP